MMVHEIKVGRWYWVEFAGDPDEGGDYRGKVLVVRHATEQGPNVFVCKTFGKIEGVDVYAIFYARDFKRPV